MTAATPSDAEREPRARPSAELVFVWIATGLATALYTPFAVVTGAGILQALSDPAVWRSFNDAAGALDAGGFGFLLIDVVGVAVLGLALAYGLYRYNRRPREADRLADEGAKRLYGGQGPVPTS